MLPIPPSACHCLCCLHCRTTTSMHLQALAKGFKIFAYHSQSLCVNISVGSDVVGALMPSFSYSQLCCHNKHFSHTWSDWTFNFVKTCFLFLSFIKNSTNLLTVWSIARNRIFVNRITQLEINIFYFFISTQWFSNEDNNEIIIRRFNNCCTTWRTHCQYLKTWASKTKDIWFPSYQEGQNVFLSFV